MVEFNSRFKGCFSWNIWDSKYSLHVSKAGFLYTAIAVKVVSMDVQQGVNVDAGAQAAEGVSGEQGQGAQLPRWNSW